MDNDGDSDDDDGYDDDDDDDDDVDDNENEDNDRLIDVILKRLWIFDYYYFFIIILNLSCFSFNSAQVFPGELHIVSLEFMDEMANSSSQIFLTTAANISSTVGRPWKKGLWKPIFSPSVGYNMSLSLPGVYIYI